MEKIHLIGWALLLIIIGAGAIGVEFAYIFNSFGAEVHIVEAMDALLPLEDKDISKELLGQFDRNAGNTYPPVGY